MVVVDVDLGCGGDEGRRGSRGGARVGRQGEASEGSILVEDQERTVAGPVGGFKVSRGDVFHVTVSGGDGHCLKAAVEDGLGGGGRKRLDGDVIEDGLLYVVLVVGADANAGVEVAREGDLMEAPAGVNTWSFPATKA